MSNLLAAWSLDPIKGFRVLVMHRSTLFPDAGQAPLKGVFSSRPSTAIGRTWGGLPTGRCVAWTDNGSRVLLLGSPRCRAGLKGFDARIGSETDVRSFPRHEHAPDSSRRLTRRPSLTEGLRGRRREYGSDTRPLRKPPNCLWWLCRLWFRPDTVLRRRAPVSLR